MARTASAVPRGRKRGRLPAGVGPALRAKALELWKDRNLGVPAIAERLGVNRNTVYRWTAEARAGREQCVQPAFVQVAVVSVKPTSPPAAPLVLVSPGGYRVEGLDLTGLAELLGALP